MSAANIRAGMWLMMTRHELSLPLSHPGVVVTVEDWGDRLFVFYWGTPQDLIVAECASEQILFAARPRAGRRDEDGDRIHVKKSSSGRWRLMRVKPRALAVHLPGVEMYLRTIAEVGMTVSTGCSSCLPEQEPRPSSKPSYLRLVIDNTRAEVTPHE
jgi:hypothetical protein